MSSVFCHKQVELGLQSLKNKLVFQFEKLSVPIAIGIVEAGVGFRVQPAFDIRPMAETICWYNKLSNWYTVKK